MSNTQTGEPQGETHPPPARVRVKLDTVNDVRREMAKIYRLARSKQIDASEASRLGNLLAMVARLIEGGDHEARLERLERAAGMANPPGGATR